MAIGVNGEEFEDRVATKASAPSSRPLPTFPAGKDTEVMNHKNVLALFQVAYFMNYVLSMADNPFVS